MKISYRLSDHVDVHIQNGTHVYFIEERRQWMSRSPIMAAICTYLDHPVSPEDIAERTNGTAGLAEVIFVLSRLEQAGIVVASSESRARPALITDISSPRLVNGVPVYGAETDAFEALGSALEKRERLVEAPALVLADDYLLPQVQDIAQMLRDAGQSFIPVKLSGTRLHYGPSIAADGPICWDCLRASLLSNRPVERYLQQNEGRAPGYRTRPLPNPQAQDFAAHIALQLNQTAENETDDRLVEWLGSGTTRDHEVRSLSGCSCGKSSRDRSATTGAVASLHGGLRTRSAEDVVAALMPFVSDLVGVVSRFEEIPQPDLRSGQTALRSVHSANFLVVPEGCDPAPEDFDGIALGKGRSVSQSQASALCEAVERISSRFRADIPVRVASLFDMGADAVPPNDIWHFSEAQFVDRDRWNRQTPDPRRHVPDPLGPDHPIAWVKARSLTRDRDVWLAREHGFGNAPFPRYGHFNPNGAAAGSTREEAILQGFLELVERDSTAIWWYNKLSRPALDPTASADPDIANMGRDLAEQGWRSWLLDITTDLAIPSFVALARHESGAWCIGFGCHFLSGVAIERAMTELAQLLAVRSAQDRAPWQDMAANDEDFLYPSRFLEASELAQDAPVPVQDGLPACVDWMVHTLARRDLDCIVLDQTHPDIGLPVWKVTVPGLRHFWPRFGPGRLYDVPVKMGWRDRVTSEENLNQTHLFL